MKKKTIFISAYRDFSIRYFLYSPVLDVLRQDNIRVVIFFKDADLEYYRSRFNSENISLEPILYEDALKQIKGSRLSRFFVLVRKCMHGRRGRIRNSTDDVRRFQYREQLGKNLFGWIRYAGLLMLAGLGERVLRIREWIVFFESMLFPGRIYDRVIEKYRPDMLLVSSLGHMIDPLFMRAARKFGCQVVSVMRNFDAPTTKDYRGAEIDAVIAWNKVMQEEVRIFHDIPSENIHVEGIAHWDFYFDGTLKLRPKEQFKKENGLTENRRIIFYATSGFKLFRRSFDVIEQLLDAIETNRIFPASQLLVRLHPAYLVRDDREGGQVLDRYRQRIESIHERYGELISFVPPRLRFLHQGIDTPNDDMYRLAETFHYADVLLNEYSTVMIEATIFDLPIINVGLHQYRDTDKPMKYIEKFTHIQRLIQTGAAKNVYTMDDLVSAINRYLEDPSLDRNGRRRLFEQEITTNIGQAGLSTGKRILALLEGAEPGKGRV